MTFQVGFQNNYVVDDGTRYVKMGLRIAEDCRVNIDRKQKLFQPKTIASFCRVLSYFKLNFHFSVLPF